jgi:hypothetical protein
MQPASQTKLKIHMYRTRTCTAQGVAAPFHRDICRGVKKQAVDRRKLSPKSVDVLVITRLHYKEGGTKTNAHTGST